MKIPEKKLQFFNNLTTKDQKSLNQMVKNAFKQYSKNGNIPFLLASLRDPAEVFGITNLSIETGISRQNLYRILSEKGNPTIENMVSILKAFGFQLVTKKLR